MDFRVSKSVNPERCRELLWLREIAECFRFAMLDRDQRASIKNRVFRLVNIDVTRTRECARIHMDKRVREPCEDGNNCSYKEAREPDARRSSLHRQSFSLASAARCQSRKAGTSCKTAGVAAT
ncbi:MAG: hypothetical protein QOE68_4427 [Thermoanaerobaculia bacterium]|nr:hypothetical protein [Thermoanaerobaculia bacterium]